jgi:hypothetical protein
MQPHVAAGQQDLVPDRQTERLKTFRRRSALGSDGESALLNRVQFETRSASLPKPPGERRSDSKSMGLELDAV